jgi:hypothetical protein
MPETRQQRRARERAAMKASLEQEVGARVAAAPSVQAMWRTFAEEVLARHGIVPGDDEVADQALVWFRRAFYAGAAGMFELVTRVAPDSVSEADGVAMIQRLHDELHTYARSLT